MSEPQLGDDRVRAMRGAVMTAVDTDRRRRARRTRQVGGALGALAVVVVIGGVGTSLVQPTSSSSSADSSSAGGSVSESSGSEGADTDDAATAERQVIVTGSAVVTADDPRREAGRIATWVRQLGGRVDVRDEQGTGDDSSAILTVRVPSDRVEDAIDRLSDSGTVESVSFQEEDVTGSVVDLDARIRALRISIDRLEAILADADSGDQVITAENALTERQQQLESLTAQRAAVDEDVALARIDVELVPRDRPSAVDPGGFGGGLAGGWGALVSTVNVVVEVAGALLPWAGVLLAGWVVLRLVRRVRT